jgi:hypothetical protein
LNVAPWLKTAAGTVEGEALRWRDEADRAESLAELGALARQAAEALSKSRSRFVGRALGRGLSVGRGAHLGPNRPDEALAQRCLALTTADFSFLYDRTRKLLSIGFRVTDHRMDESFYDLLASEARLASYVAIAAGQISFEHWFALGRHLTTVRGAPVLLSWSGSMFEYVMPLLVMPGYRGTLLDETCNGAVARQIEYGRQHGVPWGISESCHSATDIEGTYQYRAFGVPGLGLQRGLGDDLVISPYASTLALLVDPQRACANLQRMAAEHYLGSLRVLRSDRLHGPANRERTAGDGRSDVHGPPSGDEPPRAGPGRAGRTDAAPVPGQPGLSRGRPAASGAPPEANGAHALSGAKGADLTAVPRSGVG